MLSESRTYEPLCTIMLGPYTPPSLYPSSGSKAMSNEVGRGTTTGHAVPTMVAAVGARAYLSQKLRMYSSPPVSVSPPKPNTVVAVELEQVEISYHRGSSPLGSTRVPT